MSAANQTQTGPIAANRMEDKKKRKAKTDVVTSSKAEATETKAAALKGSKPTLKANSTSKKKSDVTKTTSARTYEADVTRLCIDCLKLPGVMCAPLFML